MIVNAGVYVGWRGAQALFARGWPRVLFMVAVGAVLLGLFPGKLLRDSPAGFLWHTASVGWMITLPYWVTAVVACDVLRIADRRRPFFPDWVRRHYAGVKRGAFFATVGAVALILFNGYQRFAHPVVTPAGVRIAKPCGTRPALRIAVASDLHLGDLNDRARLAKNVAQINALGADLIVLPGDIVDNWLGPLVDQNMHEEFLRLKAPLGVFAVLGNHDSFAQSERCARYLEERCAVRVLRDEAVLVAGEFYLVGRKDFSEREHRKPVGEILRGIDRAKPVILVDHQPNRLAEAAGEGVDLQISGHTHDGQVWPINWVVKFLYEVSNGLGRKGDMHVCVTSGLNLWGFPARIGTRSEVVDLRVEFNTPQTTPTP